MKINVKNTDQAYAIVIGLDSVQGLQTARILNDRGVPVIGLVKDPTHYACKTNACEEIMVTATDERELIETLQQIGSLFQQKAVLFPCEDMNVLLVSEYREWLKNWYHVVLPEHEIVEMLTDKIRFNQFAMENDLPIPKTFILHNMADAERAAEALSYPCILKPSVKTPEWTQHTTIKAFKVFDMVELLAYYDKYQSLTPCMIAQEWIEGEDTNHHTCNFYFDENSTPLVTFMSQKIRQWPPKTGQGCIGRESRNDEVRNETIRIFRNLNYYGLGYLDMKRDDRSGKYLIVEPNIGRPTGRSATAEASGVELLYTMYCDATGKPLPENRMQMFKGVKWIHIRRDLQSVLYLLRRRQLSLKELWASWRGPKTFALFSWRDPAPFFGDLTRGIRLLLSSKERKKRDHKTQLTGAEIPAGEINHAA